MPARTPPSPRPHRAFRVAMLCLAALAPVAPLVTAAAEGPAEDLAAAQELTVTASRLPTALDRAPLAATVIGRAEIERRGLVTLADALVAVPGLRLVQSGPPGASASVFLRGANSDHVLVLIDGVPANDPATSKGLFNFGSDLLADVERIEVLRGPAAGLYGSGAIGGVVNIVTRTPGADGPLRAEAELAGGSARTLRGAGTARGTLGPLDYALTLQSLSNAGWNATPARLSGNLGERDGLTAQAATLRVNLRLSEIVHLEAGLRARASRFGLDDAPRDDPNFTGDNRHLMGFVAGVASLFDGAWRSRLALSQMRQRQRFRNLPDPADTAESRDSFASLRTEAVWSNELHLADGGPLTLSSLAFGLSQAWEESETRLRSVSMFGPYAQDLDARQHAAAAWASGQTRLGGRLDLSAGVRLDMPERFDDALTWRAGAVWHLPEIASRLRAAYGTAFKAPSLFDRFGADSFGFRGNPDLRPERARGWEVGATTALPAFGRADFATVSLGYWQSRVADLIAFDFVDSTSRNVGRARLRGIEAELALRPAASLDLVASYTWTDARDAESGRRLLRRPEHQAALRLAWRPLPGLTVAPELVWIGRARDVLYADDGSFLGEGSARGGLLAHLAASWRVRPDATLILEGRNLGDARYEPANGFATPGRSVIAGVRLRW